MTYIIEMFTLESLSRKINPDITLWDTSKVTDLTNIGKNFLKRSRSENRGMTMSE